MSDYEQAFILRVVLFLVCVTTFLTVADFIISP